MAGINQLPAGAEGVAAFALIYSSISWICSILLIWCARLHREAWSYISLLAYFALISNTASIIQQAYDVTYYKDILAGQFFRKRMSLGNPELAIANGSYGLDLVLYYIQYYSYNVEAMLVMFWAFELSQSVYGLSAKPHLRQALRRVNSAGKAIAVFFPLLTILLLRAPAIQKVFVVFILLADLPLMVSLAISSITMVAILVRYVQSRKQISNWTTQRGETGASNETSTETIQTATTEEGEKAKTSQGKQGLYDKWLMVRFTVAFIILAVFEMTNTLFQLQSVNNNKKDANLTEPDYSLDRARATLFLFLPGVTPGVFLFLVFGTTAGCRTAMKGFFFSQSWRKRSGKQRRALGKPRGAVAIRDPEEAIQDPFTKSSTPDLKDGEDPSTTLRVAALVSKYNRSFSANQELTLSEAQQQYQRQMWTKSKEKPIVEDIDALELRSVASLEIMRGKYYLPTPEQSDDSGPILPIMSPRDTASSAGQLGPAVLASGRSKTPTVGQ